MVAVGTGSRQLATNRLPPINLNLNVGSQLVRGHFAATEVGTVLSKSTAVLVSILS